MSKFYIKITPKSDPIEVADALEIAALIAPDSQASQCEIITMMADDSDSGDGTVDDFDAIFDSAFLVLQNRGDLLADSYPFRVKSGTVELSDNAQTTPYTFLLLLSMLRGKAPEHKNAAKIFENLAGMAAQGYIGGESVVFGFPRETLPAGFRAALEELVSNRYLNEGRPSFDDHKASDQQDAHLDVVAWRHFGDRNAGKLIVFGQCNTGRDGSKSAELNSIRWNKRWLSGSLSPDPIAAYFIPWCVCEREWRGLCSDGGLLFERLRIVENAKVSPELLEKIARWNALVLRTIAQ